MLSGDSALAARGVTVPWCPRWRAKGYLVLLIPTLKHYREKCLTFNIVHSFLFTSGFSEHSMWLSAAFIRKKTLLCVSETFWKNLQSVHVSQFLHNCSNSPNLGEGMLKNWLIIYNLTSDRVF